MLDEDLCGQREADFPPADAWSADTSCCLFVDLSAFAVCTVALLWLRSGWICG